MKSLALVCLFLLSFSWAYAEYIPPYWVKADSLNKSVPKEKTLVKGVITDYGDTKIGTGIVGTTDFKHQTKVKEDGSFEFYIPSNYRDIFFFAIGYEEVVIYGYEFKSQHEVYIQFMTNMAGQVIEMEKPVIYAYSPESITASISLNVKGKLAFTYPLLNDKWEFTTQDNGNLLMADGKSYPYLFWEGEKDQLVYSANYDGPCGYMVQRDTCVAFLENTLTAYGLNQTEKTDFITYWGPRLVEREFAFIQFIVNDEYASQVAELNVSPKPDNMLRLFMLFTPLDDPEMNYTTETKTIAPLERNGFTVVEWGGAEIPVLNL